MTKPKPNYFVNIFVVVNFVFVASIFPTVINTPHNQPPFQLQTFTR